MKILVTGANGFLGNYLITELLKRDCEIIATDIDEKKNVENKWIEHVIYIKHNFNEKCDSYYNLFQKPDKLIHLLWEGLPNYKELYHFEKNTFTSYNLIKHLILDGCKDITAMGTCLEYGMQNGSLSEDIPSMPANPYALAKDTLRKYLEEFKKHNPFSFKWIRLFYMYGKGQNKKTILEQLKSSIKRNEKYFNMSGGEQLRDYLPVEKVTEYIVKIDMQNDITGIINCCCGKPISIRNLVENYMMKHNNAIKLNLGFYPYPDYEPMAFWGDNTKLEKILRGYK